MILLRLGPPGARLDNAMDLLPKTEAVARVRRLQAVMQETSLDAVLILQNTDLFYFSGSVQTGVLCVPASGNPVYLVQKSLERAQLESAWEHLVPLKSLSAIPDLLTAEGVARPGRIGLELDVLPASYYLRFKDSFPKAELRDASHAVRQIRSIKSPHEVEQIRRAAKITGEVFKRLPDWLRPGVMEFEIMAQVENCMRRAGHQGITRVRSFNGEMTYGPISSGPVSTYPTRFPGCVGFLGLYPAVPMAGTMRALEAGDSVIADLAGGYGGYVADVTRTFAVASLDHQFRKAQTFVLELMREIEAMLKPGVACSAIYQHALARANDSGYPDFMGTGDNHVRFIGHGVGLELDEIPVLAPAYKAPLQAGMVLAIEPKIFFAGRGGVGIENVYALNETGFEKLSDFPEEIVFCNP